eukprot:1979794-Pleurochrysis_carterae.AAC.1
MQQSIACTFASSHASMVSNHFLSSACGTRATSSKAMSRISLVVAQEQPGSARQSADFWAGLYACVESRQGNMSMKAIHRS